MFLFALQSIYPGFITFYLRKDPLLELNHG